MSRLLLSSLLLIPWLLLENLASGQQEGPVVINLLPDSIPAAAPQEELSRLSRRLGPMRLQELPEDLLRAVQWSLEDPMRSSCFDSGSGSRSSSVRRSDGSRMEVDSRFASLLEKARQEILEEDLELALATLRDARSIMPCTDVILPREQVRALFIHEGVAYFLDRNDRYKEAFNNVISVDEDTRFDVGGYPIKVRKAFEKQQEKAWKRSKVRVFNDFSGLEAYMDGAPLTEREVYAGRHLVQLKGLGGGLRTRLMEIPEAVEVPVSYGEDFGLFPLDQVKTVLTEDLRARNLDADSIAAIEQFLSSRGEQALLFAVAPNLGERTYFRAFLVGHGLVSMDEYLRSTYRVVSKKTTRGVRSRLPTLGAEALIWRPGGAAAPFPENSRTFGVGIFYERPVGPLQWSSRLALFPFRNRSVTDAESCRGETSACRFVSTSLAASTGLGFPIFFTRQLRLTPGLSAELGWLPEVSLERPDEPGQTVARLWQADLLIGGGSARADIAFTAPLDSLKLEAGAGLSWGAWWAPHDDEEPVWLFPLAFSLRAGLIY